VKVGTRSVLFGAHQFLLHPLFVALAWWRLYGVPWDPRLWVAFFVHDLGYLGKSNMDGPEGEQHPLLGARIMSALFDWNHSLRLNSFRRDARGSRSGWSTLFRIEEPTSWYDFTLFHSRFMARKHRAQFSRLCVADKLASAMEPDWFYLLRVVLSGEIREYMDVAHHREGGKYSAEIGRDLTSVWTWRRSFKAYVLRWVDEHKDCRPDTWTPQRKEAA
jgi:hypothetical protein